MKNNFLCNARRERGWTQLRLAEQLGVAMTTVRSWESGERSPSLQMRLRLCDLFGTTPAQLGLEPDGARQPLEDSHEE
jgi:transcriptional regulator with XRE-family HTH domain